MKLQWGLEVELELPLSWNVLKMQSGEIRILQINDAI